MPTKWFATMWMWQIVFGLRALATLPPERILHLNYDRLVADPAGTARKMSEFISQGAVDPEWVSRAAAVIRQRPAAKPVNLVWPENSIYLKQREIIPGVVDNETTRCQSAWTRSVSC